MRGSGHGLASTFDFHHRRDVRVEAAVAAMPMPQPLPGLRLPQLDFSPATFEHATETAAVDRVLVERGGP